MGTHLPRRSRVLKQGPDLVRSDSSNSGGQRETGHGVAIKPLGSRLGLGWEEGLGSKDLLRENGLGCDGEMGELRLLIWESEWRVMCRPRKIIMGGWLGIL